MNLGVVIPVFNQLDYTRQCLCSLRSTSREPLKIVVINNASTDGTSEYLAQCSDLTIIENHENRGCAAAWNQGVKAVASEWTVILNNDVLLTDGWLGGLVDSARENGLDIVSPAIREGPLNYPIEQYSRAYVLSMGGTLRRGVANGICFMVNSRVFDAVGLFDEAFRIGQYEDADFFQRARLGGFKLGTTGRSFIHHFGSMTQNSIKQSKSPPAYEAANRLYYRRKWQMNWRKRLMQRLRSRSRLAWWLLRERSRHGHSLFEKWRDGRLAHH